ncbi:tRNA pseudouridine synthase A [Candidatus Hecatella orcuttiae]|uniref:tRNA pseudouridine synthase A n=1 Tax=Candidatus Hecatella orcuttiae TaxID=1935119 RepID=UPI0028682ED2|nr:tRNA pseudouridine synthase A [Candidatus Hecatella orcuttiae]
MPRYAVRLYYEGDGYHGFQPQREKRTVGGEVISALLRSGLVSSRVSAHFQAASRTDRGVNALNQTVAFHADQPLNLRRLNAFLPCDIRAWAWAEVPAQFNPRKEAVERQYLYLAPYQGEDMEKMREAARILLQHTSSQAEHRKRADWLTPLKKLKVKLWRGLLLFEFSSKGFVKGAVRKASGLILKVGRGEIRLEDIGPMLQEKESCLSIPPAPPENLLLADIKYEKIKFKVDGGAVREIMGRLRKTVHRGEFARLCLAKLPRNVNF